ncbi:hypothetical protein Tco_1335457 [Tanacetum coccineum]
MPPKRTSTSEALAMTQAVIKKLVADSVSTALEAQATNMANTDNTTRLREAPVARKCSYKEFMSCQPINLKGTEGAVGLIRWFKRTESVFSCSNYTEDCKVKLLLNYLTERSSIQSKDGKTNIYHLTVKGNDLKTYVRRFQELATLCPTMVPDSEKMMEVFIGGLPRSIEGNVTASKPQTLDEANNIAQRLIDQDLALLSVLLATRWDHQSKEHVETKAQILEVIYYHFDVVIGMDWLSKYHARIICDEKVIHIPINGETLIIRVMEKKSDEKRLEDIPVVREFPEVFPEDLPGLPPIRQVEFQSITCPRSEHCSPSTL